MEWEGRRDESGTFNSRPVQAFVEHEVSDLWAWGGRVVLWEGLGQSL